MKVNNLLTTTTTTCLFIVVLTIFTTTSTCAEKKKKNSKTPLVLDIEDYIQITDWFSRYASTVDHKQWELFPDLFTKDAMIDYRASGGSYGTVVEMKQWLETVFQYFSASQHLISNIQIVNYIDQENVEVRAMFFNPMNLVYIPYKPFFTCGGWYNHKFVKMSDGKWRSKNLKVEMAFNNSNWHLGALLVLISVIAYYLKKQCTTNNSDEEGTKKKKGD